MTSGRHSADRRPTGYGTGRENRQSVAGADCGAVGETLLRVGWAEVMVAVLASAGAGVLLGVAVGAVTRSVQLGALIVAAVAMVGTSLYVITVGPVPAWVDPPTSCEDGVSGFGGIPQEPVGRAEPVAPAGSADEVAAATGTSPPVRLPGMDAGGAVEPTGDGGLELRVVTGTHHGLGALRRMATDALSSIGAEVVTVTTSFSEPSYDGFIVTWRSAEGQGRIAAVACGRGPRDPDRLVSTASVPPWHLGACAAPARRAVCEAIYEAADVLAPPGYGPGPEVGAPATSPELASVTATAESLLVLEQPPIVMHAGASGAFGAVDRGRERLVALGWAIEADGSLTRNVEGTPLRLMFAIDDCGSVTLRIETLVPVPA